VEHARRGERRVLAPQLVDEPVGRERLAGVHEQQREQRPLPVPAERHGASVRDHLERAEDAVLRGSRVAGRVATLSADPRGAQRAG
jgi:hypothetical protein